MLRSLIKLTIIFFLPLAMVLSTFLGRYPAPPSQVLQCLIHALIPQASNPPPETVEVIVLLYRLPRIVAATIVGIALACSGAALQTALRNPLIDSYILGVSSGAALGAAIALAFLPPYVPIELIASLCAFASFLLVVAIAWGWGRGSVVSIVLSGIVVNAMLSAAISLVKWMTPDPHRLASIVFWLMGDIGAAADWGTVARMTTIVLPLTAILVAMGWRLNILSLSDEEARSLGIDPARERLLIASICAVLTASTVCYTGIIGWVGLIVPHIVRLATGAEARKVVLYSIFVGGGFMVLCDDLARCLTTEVVPMNVLTTLMGVPMLVALLRRGGKVWR